MAKWKYCELHVHVKDWDARLENPRAKGYSPRDPYTAWIIANYYTPQGIDQEIIIESQIPENQRVIYEARRLLPRALAQLGSLGWEVIHVVFDGIQPAHYLLKKSFPEKED